MGFVLIIPCVFSLMLKCNLVHIQKPLCRAISGVYDCYLEILHEISQCQQHALKRNTVTWEQSHICPPCLYQTENEPKLKFSMLVAMDSNNSLKLVDSTCQAGTPCNDDCSISSFRWLSPDKVDVFKDEVKRTQCSQVSVNEVSLVPTAVSPTYLRSSYF